MLPLTARRELDDAALQHFQQCLLHALMPRVRSYRVILARFPRYLVELIKIYDAMLRPLDVPVRSVVKIPHGDLDIRADGQGKAPTT